jgi:hypothetical protein
MFLVSFLQSCLQCNGNVPWTWGEGACCCWLPGTLACCALALAATPCRVAPGGSQLQPNAGSTPRSSHPRGPQAAWPWPSSRARAFVGTGDWRRVGGSAVRAWLERSPPDREGNGGRSVEGSARPTQARAGGVVLARAAGALGARLHASRR